MNEASKPEPVSVTLQKHKSSYLRDLVYGAIDGSVSTFAVVSAVIGAHFSVVIILVLGLANLFADGFSMASANFLGTKTEKDEYDYYEDFEEDQIDKVPHQEIEEIRQIFAAKGFNEEETETIVQKITSDEKLWVKTMMREEYGLAEKIRSPWKAAICTFLAFMVCGFIPLIPFIFGLKHAFLEACISTGILFFLIGAIKSKWSPKSWWYSGFMILFIGAIAASIAFLVGFIFNYYL